MTRQKLEAENQQLRQSVSELRNALEAERRRAADAMPSRSEAMFRAICDHALHLAEIIDPNGVVQHANRAIGEFLGADPSRFIGKLVWETPCWSHSALEQDRLRAGIRRAVRGESVRFETTHRAADGSLRRMDFSLRPAHGENGEVYCLVAEAWDITERRMAEEALRASEERFVSFMRHLPGFAYLKDNQRRILFVNDRFVSDFGIPLSGWIGKTNDEIWPGEVGEKIRRDDQAVLDTGDPLVIVEDVPTRGEMRTYRTIKFPIPRPDGLPWLGGVSVDITGLQQAEQALRKSESVTRSIIESIPIGMHIYQLESDGRLVFTGSNPAAERLVGVDHSTFIGKTIEEAFPGLVATEVPQRYRDAAAHGTPWHSEQINYHEGAIQGAFEVHAFQIAPRRMVASFQNITARKRDDEALRKANRQLRMVTDCTQAVIRVKDETELLAAVCNIAVQTGGYRMAWVGYAESDEHKTVRPMPHAGVEDGFLENARLHWEDSERGRGPSGTAIRTGRPCAIQNIASDDRFTPWREDAIDRGYAAVCSLPLTAGDRIFGVLGIYSSVPDAFDAAEVGLLSELANDLAFGIIALRAQSEQKQAEDALRASEERFKRLVQNSNDIIVIMDRNAVPTSISGPAEKILGYEPAELIGKSGYELIHPDDLEKVSRAFAEAIPQPNATRRVEYRFRNKSGTWVALEAVGANLLHDPFVRGVVISVRDVSERNKLQEQLQQAMKMEAVGRLSGGIAHDFNNLLTTIIGHVELAMMQLSASDPLVQSFEEISKAAGSAASLTRQLLAFSRRQIIEPKTLNINDLILNIQKMMTRLIGEDIELQTVLCPEIGSVRVDPGQFEQVLVNLAVNARDSMPNGGRLVIETRDMDLDEQHHMRHPLVPPGKFVLISVADTGHGMDEVVKQHLFEPFFTTKSVGHGTGLGLATTFGIVNQAGGAIEVYSEVGTGTTFKIYLPRVEMPAEDVFSERTGKAHAGGTETILLVEDNHSVRRMALLILKRLGYSVLQASNGAEALLTAENYDGQIDLLVTDVVMPGINGRDLAERLLLNQPKMKILFTSGYTEDVIVHHGVIEENLNFIGKPYSPQSLARKIREVLEF